MLAVGLLLHFFLFIIIIIYLVGAWAHNLSQRLKRRVRTGLLCVERDKERKRRRTIKAKDLSESLARYDLCTCLVISVC